MKTTEADEQRAPMAGEKDVGADDSASQDRASPAPAAVFDAKLCSKLDFRILTPMFFLNFLSLMGRTNIGAALIQKLPVDLKMDAMKTFLAIAMPVVMLILFEVPSNLLMRWFDRRFGLSYMRYLSLITVGLGEYFPYSLISWLSLPPYPHRPVPNTVCVVRSCDAWTGVR